ncbi:pilus assembly protein [Altererythrobacter sp.]|uniref:TadE/TadG family type IV pilus assembly protein n=1 Tax=Altererythrobacter sp. TaxID=1872480 RepID=UPI001AFEC61C|nr:pilus assembly protein [Altererythrobacter sp.]MBO6608741.1 pilus assembly protein [Altererythrobacter sp.]MBO6642996.1 pilus assembly protein [Altererythrobacter sp.]MBO6709739.1 pilus assembly protein [Altererythrobacter sp.]
MMVFLRRFFTDAHGAAAAEMALIVPISILLLFTGFETGHYFYQQHQIVKALRDGARYAARQSFDEANCRGGTAKQFSGTVLTEIQSLARTGQIGGTTPRIKNWTSNGQVSVTVTCPTVAESQTGIYDGTERAPQVTLTTQFNYDSIFNGLGIITDSYRIGATQQATVMGI